MRNIKIKTRILVILASILIFSCEDDFLERKPLDALSEDLFFNTATDLQTYVNHFYDEIIRYQQNVGNRVMNLNRDLPSDILISGRNITASFDQIASSGIAPTTNSQWNNSLNKIRRANFFIKNYHKVDSRNSVSNQFIGEGYFWRAWFYFDFLVNFGDVPIVSEPLNINDEEELYRPRDSRFDVAKFIIQDLDSAITNLQWKGKGEAKSGRINKETALVLKARVALFEGTWEHYHSVKGTNFAVTGKNGEEFLELIEPTIQNLIDHQGASIFRDGGIFNEPYNQLTSQESAETTEGVFWYRIYDKALLGTGHNFHEKISDNTLGLAITKRLIDLYLDVDGVPQSLSDKPLNTLNEMGQNLDPRFRQTIWTPDRGPLDQLPGRGSQLDYSLRYPVIVEGVTERYTSTGIRNFKGAIFAAEFRNGFTDDVLIRYAEGLLAYAEAKAILGTINQTDLDKTVNLLRSRVNMEPMILSEVNSWNVDYNKKEGFDPSEPNIVNEIRRERTIELALEGFRLNDLKRWAVFDDVINGYKPKGAPIQEFLDYFNDEEALAQDGWKGADLSLIKGSNVDSHSDGFINPYFLSTQFQESGEGFWINKDRDYLLPVPTSEIMLYEERGYNLTQNPGWN
jgi:starch-binding outer membrane protein, SusD/RagB family